MKECHECGSELGEVDVFCPFCGISVKSVSAEAKAEAHIDESPASVDDSKDELPSTISEADGVSRESEEDLDMSETIMMPLIPKLTEESADEEGLAEVANLGEDSEAASSERVVSQEASPELEVSKESSSDPVKTSTTPDDGEDVNSDLMDIEGAIPDEVGDKSELSDVEPDESIIKPPVNAASNSANAEDFDFEGETVLRKNEAASEEESDIKVGGDNGELEPSIPADVSAFDEFGLPVGEMAEEPAEVSVDNEELQMEADDETESSETVADDHLKAEPSAAVEIDESGGASSETTPNIGVEDTDGSNKTKLKPLDEGTVLNGRYEIVRKIGGGGMGAVYLANDRNLGGVLRAVKEMVQSYIEEEQQEKAVNDFKRESMLLTSLEHSSIPTIYDYFFDKKEGRFYLVMKYISGGDLAGRLRSAPEGRLDEKLVVEWGVQIADVLDYLHSKEPPIVYRDLKPANVMIDGNSDRVMLIDFGIARWVNKEEKGVTAVGTMGYAPPELFSGNVEPRSDIYSLGSTMFHLLTGADPQSNPLLIFDFQKHPRPRQINPALSDQIEQILMRCVEYSADGRFESAGELRESLSAHLTRINSGNVSFGVKETPQAVGLADQPVFCGFCGQKIIATDMFCAFCGAKQPLAQPGVHSEEYVPVQKTARLLIEGTEDLDAPAFSLVKDENLLGRRDPISNIFPEVDLSKFDPQTKISRKHARIWRDGDRFMLEDLNSSNGTVLIAPALGTVRLSPQQSHVLTNGDKIQMGDTTLHFVVN